MNLVTMTEAKLSVLRRAVANEIGRRTCMAVEGWDAAQVIYGNELAKRALIVAAAGKHSLLLVGPTNSGKTMLRAAALVFGLAEVFEARSCPCGQYGARDAQCRCSAAQIARHRRRWPVADMNVEMRQPHEREIKRIGTSLADMRRQIEGAVPRERVSGELCEAGEHLLRASVHEFALDLVATTVIRDVARTIAALDCETAVRPSHISEAINYRAFPAYIPGGQARRAGTPATG